MSKQLLWTRITWFALGWFAAGLLRWAWRLG